MNLRWALGVVAALLAATMFLPGLASAHDGTLNGDPSCKDAGGSWTVTWTVETTFVDETDYLVDLTVDVNDGGVADDLDLGDFEASLQNLDDTSGTATTTYGPSDDPHSSELGANDVDEFTGNIEYIEFASGFTNGDWNYGVSNIITQPDYCIESACVAGDFVDQPVNLQETNDCDPVRICLDGESMTVTEFDAEKLDAEKGSCTPGDDPPPPSVTEEEPVEEVEVAVLEPAPAVEEVAALPAAGYGTGSDARIAWTLVLGLALIGVGGVTVLIARRS